MSSRRRRNRRLHSGTVNTALDSGSLEREVRAAAYRAATAVCAGRPLPRRTRLEQDASRQATRAYCDMMLSRMWGRVRA